MDENRRNSYDLSKQNGSNPALYENSPSLVSMTVSKEHKQVTDDRSATEANGLPTAHTEKLELKMTEEEEEATPDPLARTGRFFGGAINDIRRRYPKYLSDITDAFNLQCLSTVIFIYFACLSPAITFGGLLSASSSQLMGVTEMLVVVGGCGIIFSIFSCQPLTVVGATGPVLVFEEGLIDICELLDLELLPMRVWVGVWVAVVSFVLVMFDGSSLVKFFTRFTEEIFAVLVSFIFITSVFFNLADIFREHPLKPYYPGSGEWQSSDAAAGVVVADVNSTNTAFFTESNNGTVNGTQPTPEIVVPEPNTALLSVILTFGTFFIAYGLRMFRNSKFLPRQARRAIGDFGVPIAILIMVLIDYFALGDTYTEKLNVPGGFQVTLPDQRGWFINPMGEKKSLPVWAIPLGFPLAILVFVLIFMETQIASMILNKPERKLKKGSGYFFDLLLIGSFGLISGFMGLPFLCTATVRAVTHITACTITGTGPDGKAQVQGAHEQRLTGFLIHVLITVSVFLGPLLREISMAVLYGIFLYMGVTSMFGIQFLERVLLLFMPKKHHPPELIYVQDVRTMKMHIYTLIQLVGLGVLWAVKSTIIALAFPFVLIILVPIRLKLLTKIFSRIELIRLDNDGSGIPDEFRELEPDFETEAHNIPNDPDNNG